MEKDPNKVKALEAAIAQIEKSYGQGSIMKLGDTQHMQVEAVPTGSLSLDLALGVGGIPKGRIIEVGTVDKIKNTTNPFVKQFITGKRKINPEDTAN